MQQLFSMVVMVIDLLAPGGTACYAGTRQTKTRVYCSSFVDGALEVTLQRLAVG